MLSNGSMAVFELVMALLLGGALLSAWARRLNAPYPAMLALAGAALALIPSVPSVALDPQLALALFVAPVLLDAAFDSSPRDLKRNWRAVTSLALAAVGLTVGAVALVARWMVPDLSWPAAVTLGAIVAPPDAAAATAVLKQLPLPRRLMVILEGESLFNDASALLIYRLAVAAALTGTFSGWWAIPTLAVVSLGSAVLGLVLSRVILLLNERVEDIATSVIFQFLGTFSVWLLAERLHLSGIITVVVFAIAVARTARTPARLRLPSYAVWEVAVYVLNVLAFILVGLQLKPILANSSGPQLERYLITSGAVCGAVMLVRILWVMGYATVARWVIAGAGARSRSPSTGPSFRSATVVAWCGMRGIVTLAAALALPPHFPQRDLILFASFAVVLGTLVIQGLTLSPLIRLLRLEDDGAGAREVSLARAETLRAALAELGHHTTGRGPDEHRPHDPQDQQGQPAESAEKETASLVRRQLEHRLARAEQQAAPGLPRDNTPFAYAELLRHTQRAERRTLFDLRARGVIGDDAFHRVEEELDWAELNVDGMSRSD